MKNLLLLLTLSIFWISPVIGQKYVNKLIDVVKKEDRAVAMTLPGWLIRSGSKFALQSDGETLEPGYMDLIDGIKKLRFATVSDHHNLQPNEIKELLSKIRSRDGFDDYVVAREKSQKINVLVREEDEIIKNLFVFVAGEHEAVALNFTTEITMEQLEAASLSFNKHRDKEKQSF